MVMTGLDLQKIIFLHHTIRNVHFGSGLASGGIL
jgi:hypothetical protein